MNGEASVNVNPKDSAKRRSDAGSGKLCLVCSDSSVQAGNRCTHDEDSFYDPSKDPLVGTVLADRYKILNLLGVGGWSKVYAAQHLTLRKQVAVKILHEYLAFQSQKVERFQQEAEALSNLTHPNLCAIHDFGETPDGLPFFVMDKIEGTSLSQIIRNTGRIEPQRAVQIFLQACAALSEAHRHGIIHRDVKPGNIVLTTSDDGDQVVKLVDFGLAKFVQKEDTGETNHLTRTGETVGTPAYMSPEQCMGRQLDGRSDIYALACVMYDALTGRAPFSGDTAFECMMNHIQSEPASFAKVAPDARVPAHLEAVVMKGLEKSPDDRYQSIEELRADLAKCVSSKGGNVVAKLRLKKNLLRKVGLGVSIFAGMIGVLALTGACWVLLDKPGTDDFVDWLAQDDIHREADIWRAIARCDKSLGFQTLANKHVTDLTAKLAKHAVHAATFKDASWAVNYATAIDKEFGLPQSVSADRYFTLANSCVTRGQSKEAWDLYHLAYQLGDLDSSNGKRAALAAALKHQGDIFSGAQRLIPAESNYLRSAAIYSTFAGDAQKPSGFEASYWQTLSALGWFYVNHNKLPMSIIVFRTGVDMNLRANKNDHHSTAQSMRMLADALKNDAQPEEAESWYVKAIREAEQDADKTEQAYGEVNLADLYCAMHRFPEAKKFVELGLERAMDNVSADLPQMVYVFRGAANLYSQAHDTAQTENTYKRGIRYFAEHHREKDPMVAPLLDEYASFLGRMPGREKDALAIHDQAESLRALK